MRGAIEQWIHQYPAHPIRQDGTFAQTPVRRVVEQDLVNSVTQALGERAAEYLIRGSIGQGDWTHTPWLVLLDPAVTTNVGKNYYVVYLLSLGKQRLYLSIAQGCTTLKEALGLPLAAKELARRANIMSGRLNGQNRRLNHITMDLDVTKAVWRGKLYEQGCVLGKEYDARDLPDEHEMRADLIEALDLYRHLRRNGGWAAEDAMIEEATGDQVPFVGLRQAKTYREHRTIERDSGHSAKVKQCQGTRCRACGFDMGEVYGSAGAGVCDAHHLTPLAILNEGEVVTFDPSADFAVLCPNCHRAIHRLPDSSDVNALRAALRAGALSAVLPI